MNKAKASPIDPKTFVAQALLQGLKPDPTLTVSEWADRYRKLSSKASSEAGPWRTDRTPYLREIMDALSPSSLIERVVFMKGAQVGGTEAGNNWIGFIIDYAPAPTMVVMPTVETAKRTSKNRIAPLIEESPRLKEKVKNARARDSGNTVLQKDFPGGVLILTGANSGVGLRSQPVKFLMLDEKDGYPGDVDDEGDPATLAKARTRTFSRRKIYEVSTPTVEGMSRIAKDYEESDQRRYFVPCPHCSCMQVLKFSGLKWPKDEPHKAVYVCEECKREIPEFHKTKMLNAGQWIAARPGAANSKIAGFHLSALYSPLGWYSWGEIAELWEQAQKDPAMLRGFINTVLGETWKEKGDAPEWERLFHRRESYKIGTIPAQAVFLTMGIDVQKDRVEYEVVGWGPRKESWSIDYGVIEGDMADEATWFKLDEALARTYPKEQSGELPILMAAIDTGYNTQHVYSFCRRHPMTKLIAVKGQDSLPVAVGHASLLDINIRGRAIKRGIRVYPVGVSVIKSELYSWLRMDPPTDPASLMPAGYCHFPQYDETYFKMLTAEELVIKIRKGFKKYEWQKIRDRNEALDCRVYARAAANMIGIDRFTDRHWQSLGAKIEDQRVNDQRLSDLAQVKVEPSSPQGPVAQRSRTIIRRKGTFL